MPHAQNAIGQVKTQRMSPDEALLSLYRHIAAKNAPAEGSFATLSPEERRAYFRDAKRRSRGRDRQAAAKGAPIASVANIRAALADAALMILATDGDGAELVREVLAGVFAARPGVAFSVQSRARQGKLRPKIVTIGSGA